MVINVNRRGDLRWGPDLTFKTHWVSQPAVQRTLQHECTCTRTELGLSARALGRTRASNFRFTCTRVLSFSFVVSFNPSDALALNWRCTRFFLLKFRHFTWVYQKEHIEEQRVRSENEYINFFTAKIFRLIGFIINFFS